MCYNNIRCEGHDTENKKDETLAQPVEHRPFKAGVEGSNPSCLTENSAEIQQSFLIYPEKKE